MACSQEPSVRLPGSDRSFLLRSRDAVYARRPVPCPADGPGRGMVPDSGAAYDGPAGCSLAPGAVRWPDTLT